MGNLLTIERSTCVRPNPGMSFRPSVPCRTVDGIENAFGLRLLPPGAAELAIHSVCPSTRSGLVSAFPSGSGELPTTIALKGSPLRATITVSTDQSRVRAFIQCDLDTAGMEITAAPEKLCRTSKSEEA